MALGLAIALLLNIDLPYMRILRTALVIPMMITPIVGALCWKLLLEPSLGFVNYLIGQKIVWLGMPDDGAGRGLGGRGLAEYALCRADPAGWAALAAERAAGGRRD